MLLREPVMLAEALLSPHSVARPAFPSSRSVAAPLLTLDDHLSRAPLQGVEAKEHVFAEGDGRSHVYRIETGAVCLYRVMTDGRRQVLGFAYPGDLIGLGTSGAHPFNAQAIRASRLRALPWATVQTIARRDPAFGIKLYEVISEELEAARDLLMSTGQRTAIERIAAFLLAMSRRIERRGGTADAIELPMTRSDIGDFLGLTIETVSRTFTKLRQRRVIDLKQCALVQILDIDALEELADGERQL
jgi:CRP-like cAMP-binding protein